MVLRSSFLEIPTPLVEFPCGSESMRRTRSSDAARAAARLMAVVVLPTPPFWLAMEMTWATVQATAYHVSRETFTLPSKPHVSRETCARLKYTSRTETAAGVTPGIRPAWPSVTGRTRVSFCRTSFDSPGMHSYEKSVGNLPSLGFDQPANLAILLQQITLVLRFCLDRSQNARSPAARPALQQATLQAEAIFASGRRSQVRRVGLSVAAANPTIFGTALARVFSSKSKMRAFCSCFRLKETPPAVADQTEPPPRSASTAHRHYQSASAAGTPPAR